MLTQQRLQLASMVIWASGVGRIGRSESSRIVFLQKLPQPRSLSLKLSTQERLTFLRSSSQFIRMIAILLPAQVKHTGNLMVRMNAKEPRPAPPGTCLSIASGYQAILNHPLLVIPKSRSHLKSQSRRQGLQPFRLLRIVELSLSRR